MTSREDGRQGEKNSKLSVLRLGESGDGDFLGKGAPE